VHWNVVRRLLYKIQQLCVADTEHQLKFLMRYCPHNGFQFRELRDHYSSESSLGFSSRKIACPLFTDTAYRRKGQNVRNYLNALSRVFSRILYFTHQIHCPSNSLSVVFWSVTVSASSNQQVANLLSAQANSASYPQRDEIRYSA